MAWALVTEEMGHRPRFLYFLHASWEGIGTGSDWDHGALAGLLDDDHTQYSLVDGTRAFTGDVEITTDSNTTLTIISGTNYGAVIHLKNDVGYWTTGCNTDDSYFVWDKVGSTFAIQAISPPLHKLLLNTTLTALANSSSINRHIWTDDIYFIQETANANMDVGITINQSGYDTEILAFKSTDVAHGLTALAETDTYGKFRKADANGGGLGIYGLRDSGGAACAAIQMIACLAQTPDTGFDTAARSITEIWSYYCSGTSVASAPAESNLFSIHTYTASDYKTLLVLNANGDLGNQGNHYVGDHKVVSNIGVGRYVGICSSSHQGIVFDATGHYGSTFQVNMWYSPTDTHFAIYSSGDSGGAGAAKYLMRINTVSGAFIGAVASYNPWVLDEDLMGSDSAQHCATQQSIKAYADRKLDYTYQTAVSLTGMTSYTISSSFSASYVGVRVLGYYQILNTANCPVTFQIHHDGSGWITAGYLGTGDTVSAGSGGIGFSTGTTSWMLVASPYWDSTYYWSFIFDITWHAGNHILTYVKWKAWDHTNVWWSSGCGLGPYGGCNGLRVVPYVAGAAWTNGYLYWHYLSSYGWG